MRASLSEVYSQPEQDLDQEENPGHAEYLAYDMLERLNETSPRLKKAM